jgi:peptidoglycan/xylan/chitin deacetylase (PgdA/CDA1 family)
MKTEPKPIKSAQRKLEVLSPPYPVPRTPFSTNLVLLVAALLALLYFVSARPLLDSDPASKSLWGLTTALATERSLTLDRYIGESNNPFLSSAADFPALAYFQGHYYSDQPPGAAFLAVPAYLSGQLFGDPATYGLAFTALLAGGIVLLLYGLARRLGCGGSASRFAAFAVGLATLLWREGTRFAPPVFSMLFLGLVLWLALPLLPRDLAQPAFVKENKIRWWRGFALGVTSGYAVVIEYSNAVWLLPLGIYLLGQKRATLKAWLGILIGGIVGLAPLLVYHYLIFGKIYAFTYGFQIADPTARRLVSQFSDGFSLNSLWQIFFGSGRAFMGFFILLFGVWGLCAMWVQRGKRATTALFIALALLIFIAASMRYIVAGSGQVQSDFAAPLVIILALGAAVWFERFMFINRLELFWIPTFSTCGLAIHYFINPLGFPNLAAILPVLPLLVLIVALVIAWRFARDFSPVQKALALVALWLIFGFLGLIFSGGTYPAVSLANNNLFSNSTLDPQNGWYITKNGNRQNLLPYLIPVQGGKLYTLSFNAANTANLKITWRWDDDSHQGLQTFAETYPNPTTVTEKFAAPPGSAYLQLTLEADTTASLTNFAFFDNGVRLEPLKYFASAAVAFSFDWESAMGGLIHSRGGAFSEGEVSGKDLTEATEQEAVKYAAERGLEMRKGADNLAGMFKRYNIRASFYATGYNLLDGNTGRKTFSDNPIYKWANPENRWGTDYWTRNFWFKHDPYGTVQTDPAWYFGDQTDRLFAAGHEIASHTFGHLYVKATSPAEFARDFAEWQNQAKMRGLPPAQSFAFPWQSSNSLGKEHYDVLYNAGFRIVTRLNLTQQDIKTDAQGTLYYGDRNPSLTPNPNTVYFYLTRPRYAPRNGKEGAIDPRFYVLSDYMLVPGAKSETTALNLIDDLLKRRGSYGSIWTHPEAVVKPEDVATWDRVIAYAANLRTNGLWVDTVEALVQHRIDVSKVKVKTEWKNGGKSLKITLTNPTARPIEGLTLTMPRPVASAPTALRIKDAQLLAPTLAPNATLTLEVNLK